MSLTGLDVFDRTVHTTNRWLQELINLLDGGSRHDAYVALRATLHALRDRLPVEETAELAAQLPMLVRGFYYEGWDPTGKPVPERSLEGFLAGVAVELPIDADPESVARAVFALLARRVSDGEIQDVKGVLPTVIRELWPAAPRAA
jgi:uncharacterized protein (DUF2267 family)